VTEDVEALHVFDIEQREHVLGNRLRLVAVVGFVAVGVSPKIRGNKRKPVTKPVYDGKELTVVLRPAMHAQDHRATACRDVMKSNIVRFGALMR